MAFETKAVGPPEKPVPATYGVAAPLPALLWTCPCPAATIPAPGGAAAVHTTQLAGTQMLAPSEKWCTMLSIRVDQFEFANPGSEEAIEIDVSRQTKFPHPDVVEFVKSTVGAQAASVLGEPQPFYRVSGRDQICEYIKRFANIEVPPYSDWLSYTLEPESWDQTHLIICAPGLFIRYHWSTTA